MMLVSRKEGHYDRLGMCSCHAAAVFFRLMRQGKLSDAVTHVDIFCQQVICGLVLLEHVVVHSRAGKGGAEEETEETVVARGRVND